MSEEYLTTEEAATRLRVSEESIRRWCRAGRLPAVRIGRAHRIPLAAVLALTAGDHAQNATPAAPAERARQPLAPPRPTTPAEVDDLGEQLPAGWTRVDPMPAERGARAPRMRIIG